MEELELELNQVLATIEQQSGAEAKATVEEAVKTDTPGSRHLLKEGDADEHDIRRLVSEMSMAQKIKTALLGNATCRRLLIFDPNRLIQDCVLNNPRIALHEIEDFSKNTTVDAQVLRSIANNSNWMKSYKVKLSLVTNAKCPLDLSLKWLKFLQGRDIKNIAKSKNVPQVLQNAAKKLAEG